jgi:UDP-N-acetylglucosamine 2-epimerase (non-hydrolysing)
MKKLKVMSVFGTRPEAVKMCPLVKVLEGCPEIDSMVCLTGQHRQMLDQVMGIFGITAEYDLDIMKPNQTLTTITSDVLAGMETILTKDRPDLVLVHGDTTTSFAAALSAFYQKIPVGHVEAGLRTYDKYSPFPEEINRTLTGHITELHFAPTETSRRNLEAENITRNVFVTGNTVIDSFATTVKANYLFRNDKLRSTNLSGKKIILMTAHRRENLGAPMRDIFSAVKRIAAENPDVLVLYPVHLNPAVRETAFSVLGGLDRVVLLDPIEVDDMHNLMAQSYLVLTDSGGLQEEAPSFGIPVLVLRTETERPEAVEAGTVKMAGVKEDDVYCYTNLLLHNDAEYQKMARSINPYGDGHASERILEAILRWGDSR